MENQTAPAATENQNGPMLAIQSVYLKDCSYEAPKGPRIDGNWSPQISLDINTTANVVAPELNEVVLTVTVGAKQGETTAFLVEVKQAGLFVMRGLNAEDQRRAIGTICPNVLFPYARVAVSQLVTQGGFPNFVLPPVDFDQLFARGLQQQAAQTPRRARRTDAAPARRSRRAQRREQPSERHRAGTRRRARRRFLGNGARDPVRARRSPDPAVEPQRQADAAQMRAERHNRRYLPDAKFPGSLEVHDDLAAAVKDAVAIIIAVPSHALRALLTQLKPLLARDARLAWATKGFELDTGKLPHQVAYDVLGDRYPVAVLSGPDVRARGGHGPADGDDHRLTRRGIRGAARQEPARLRISAPTPRPTSSAWRSAAR